MTSLEAFADAIKDGDSAKVQLLISTAAFDINARLPRVQMFAYAMSLAGRRAMSPLIRLKSSHWCTRWRQSECSQ
jgi:hypothetical protein